MSGIWVILEDRDGRIGRASWEALAAGQRLAELTGQPLNAAVIGSATETLAAEAATKSVAKVARIEHPLLERYTADAYTIALDQFIQSEQPGYVVFPHTYQVRDFAPALASRTHEVLISDVIAIGEGPVFTRQLLQGRLTGNYRHSGSGPCFVSVQAGAFRADAVATGAAEIAKIDPQIDPRAIRTKPGEPFRGSAQTVDLGSAPSSSAWAAASRKPTTSRSSRSLPPRWVPSSPPPAPFATTAGCPWSARWEAPARPSRRSFISLSASPAPSSILLA